MPFSLSFSFGLLTATRSVASSDNPTDSVSPAVRVKVYPRWYHYAALEWTVPAAWGDCVFNVYHSTTEGGNYVKVNKDLVNGNGLIDYTAQDYSEFRGGWYVVEALLDAGRGARIRSQPAMWQNVQRRWVEIRAEEIQRREFILLRKFTGVKSYLFKRKTYGQRCPACWDPVSETVTDDHCTTCFGTSFAGGYFPPQPLFVQYDASPNQVQKTYSGRLEPNVIGAWTLSMPQMASDDIIIRIGDWNVYRVSSVQTTELQANPVRQILQLDQLSRRDVENELVTKRLAEFPTELATINARG